ncbi:MAG TPA: glycosyl transferase family 90 [Acetobacteraceae bacterium]|nr:glycosyl transferase family 90 [Acetobacteraceae bacterium]
MDTGNLDPVAQDLAAWAEREISPWREQPLWRPAVEARMRALQRNDTRLFRFQFADGSVRLLPTTHSGSTFHRAQIYLAFFAKLVAFLPADYSATICVCLGDLLQREKDVPIFAFQRSIAQRIPLLPDIDLLVSHFLSGPYFVDGTPTAAKEKMAMFVGSTTGGMIDEATARAFALPRLRAAHYFSGNTRVDFRLPNIAQTVSAEAYEFLKQQPFCQFAKLPWPNQLKAKFLLSMDGNGATCLRVAAALLSNSVLLKYHSEQILYYFPALTPWVHYVPVHADTDVEPIMDKADAEPELFDKIAAAGKEFAQTYLTEARGMEYTALLLQRYASLFDPPSSETLAVLPERIAARGRNAALATLKPDEHGWIGRPGSGEALTGYKLVLRPRGAWPVFYCQAVEPEGGLSPVVTEGEWVSAPAGPLHGIRVELVSKHVRPPAIGIEAIFTDGTTAEEILTKATCQSPSGAPLEAFRLRV